MSAPSNGAPQTAARKTVEVIVATGRTINKSGPGEKVTVTVDEAETLRRLGFAIDPKAPEVPHGNGPRFSTDEGPKIHLA